MKKVELVNTRVGFISVNNYLDTHILDVPVGPCDITLGEKGGLDVFEFFMHKIKY